ncbi:MAG: thioredoxin family protein [Aureliella sp.]
MRDYLLSRINQFEHWLENEARGLRYLPARVAGYLGLVMLLMISNLIAMAALCVEVPLAFIRRLASTASKNRPPTGRQTDSQAIDLAAGAQNLQCDGIDLSVPIDVDEEQLEKLIRSHERVLVDVWAPWCGPCRMMKPALKEVAEATADRLLVVAVNATTQPGLAKRFNAAGLPTLVVIRDGSEAGRHAGALSKDALLDLVRKHLPDL